MDEKLKIAKILLNEGVDLNIVKKAFAFKDEDMFDEA